MQSPNEQCHTSVIHYRGGSKAVVVSLGGSRLEVEPDDRQRHWHPKPQTPFEHVGLGRVELGAYLLDFDAEFRLSDAEFRLGVEQSALELLVEPPELRVEKISELGAVGGLDRVQAVHQ